MPILRKTAGIREVANLSGFSTATVSRTINGSSKVKQKTADRVKKAMTTLNFSPNIFAQELARHKKTMDEQNDKKVEAKSGIHQEFFRKTASRTRKKSLA